MTSYKLQLGDTQSSNQWGLSRARQLSTVGRPFWCRGHFGNHRRLFFVECGQRRRFLDIEFAARVSDDLEGAEGAALAALAASLAAAGLRWDDRGSSGRAAVDRDKTNRKLSISLRKVIRIRVRCPVSCDIVLTQSLGDNLNRRYSLS